MPSYDSEYTFTKAEMSPDEAEDFLRRIGTWGLEELENGGDKSLPCATSQVVDRVRSLRQQVELLTARMDAAREKDPFAYLPVHVLTEGSDAGGPRHFLGAEKVSAGTSLLLLTTNSGWISGGYEWGFRSGTPGNLNIRLPGPECVEATILLYPGARMAFARDLRTDR